MKIRAIGIIELGSVPSPPKKPKSWMRTQVATQNTDPTMTPDPYQTEVTAQEGRTHSDQQDHDHEVDQPPVTGLEGTE